MKKLLSVVLCALFAIHGAEARTLYVNANAKNNKGSGLSVKKAKKTIQAAINIAKAGDTILVYPGSYAPVKTNNKKIAIKSVKGAKKTSIVKSTKKTEVVALANLGKSSTYVGTFYKFQSGKWVPQNSDRISSIDTKGTSTKLLGFTLDGHNRFAVHVIGVSGGTVKSCTITRLKGPWQATACVNGKLTQCIIKENQCLATDGLQIKGGLVSNATLQRCRIQDNECGYDDYYYGVKVKYPRAKSPFSKCKLYNCLVTSNLFAFSAFSQSTLQNCSVVDNFMEHNTYRFSVKSKYYNCILWNNYCQRAWKKQEFDFKKGLITHTYTDPVIKLHNVDKCCTYRNTDMTNKNPQFMNTAKKNYKLTKGSYCIDKGKLTVAQKKLVGTKDLAGKKRIKGKAVDRGCYEY